MIGRTLGHYEILDKIGQGGMGEVYRARDTRLDREVALKILPADFASDRARVRRFEQEARAASALNHPNITHVYDFDEDGGVSFLAMELVDGQDLAHHMAGKPLPMGEALGIASQVAAALVEAHVAGITHRDLKPANIMLNKRGEVKILDFGLAKYARADDDPARDEKTLAMTQVGTVIGTAHYMSPEQAVGGNIDSRSDLFSLGIILYEMVAGRKPFEGKSSAEVRQKVTASTAEPVSTFASDAPGSLELALRKCLEKEPDRRYQSANELLVDLNNLKRDSRSSAERRSKVPIAIFAVVAIAAALVFLLPRVMAPTSTAVASIAVLPFENASADPETEYLCDGLAESLINTLSQDPDLRVISRLSAFQLKGRDLQPEEIGEQLNVQAVLIGRLEQRDDQLSVSAELIDVRDNHQIWGGRYSHPADDILALEADLTRTISDKLRLKLGGEPTTLVAQQHSNDSEAYRLFLRGREYIVGSSREMDKAVEYLEAAIQRQPDYALAYSTLSLAHVLQAAHSTEDSDVAVVKARAAVRRAMELDPDLAEAHATSGTIKWAFDWDWSGADQDFQRAIQLNPGSVYSYIQYSDFLLAMNRVDEIIEVSTTARLVDPISTRAIHWLAIGYLAAGNYQDAIDGFKQAVELNPNWTWGYVKLAKAYSHAGMKDEALAAAALGKNRAGDDISPLMVAWIGDVYARVGETEMARAEERRLLAMADNQFVDPCTIAELYLGLGETRTALDYLERGYEERSVNAAYMPVFPALFAEELADEPRYQRLLRLMDLSV